MINSRRIGRRIAALRLEKGWHGLECAKRIGISGSTLSYLEKGDFMTLRPCFFDICMVFSIQMEDLLKECVDRRDLDDFLNNNRDRHVRPSTMVNLKESNNVKGD